MSLHINIDGRKIGSNFSPYIIAEMSANHNGSIENAFRIIDMAKKAGADAIKLQTYKPDTLTIKSNHPDFQLTDGIWAGQSLYDLYSSAFMPWEWHKPLYEYCKKLKITVFSSPFDKTAVDLLEDLETPAYKIASFEAVDIPLIEYVAKTGKPMIISTGMADNVEINEAIEAARGSGCMELALLHCVSGYPAPAEDYNLKTLVDMQKKFGLVTGLSDHTIENITAISSIALGASIIEKHVTLNRLGGGVDDSFSIESKELACLCVETDLAWKTLGKVDYGRKSSEQSNVKFRRSLYFVKDMKKGASVTEECVKSIRPGFGISPKHFNKILGKVIIKDVKKGEPVKFEVLKQSKNV